MPGYETDFRQLPFPEQTSPKLSFLVTDEDEVGLAAASLSTLTMTLFDELSLAIINSRSNIDILNANNGTVDSSGNGTWVAAPDDTKIQDESLTEEVHIAMFRWTWQGGSRGGAWRVRHTVKNFAKIAS